MRPRSYFLIALASAATLLIAAWATRSPECVQTSPTWLTPFVFILAAVSVGSIFASILALRRQEGGNLIAWLIPAAVGTAIWGGVGYFALSIIVVPDGCLG